MNDLLEVLRLQGARIIFKINVEKIKSLSLATSENRKILFDIEKIHQVDSFTYLGFIISEDGGSSVDVKSKIARLIVFFLQ